jgi:hypothetical protein
MIDDLRLMIENRSGQGPPPRPARAETRRRGERPDWIHLGPCAPVVQTNPISASRTGLRRAKRAKQTQTWVPWGIWRAARRGSLSCQKKPIGPSGRCPVGTPQLTESRGRLYKQTQWPRANPAKQSQFGKGGWGPGADSAKQTQFPTDSSCETKPICPDRAWGTPGAGSCTNKAKLRRVGVSGGAGD